MAPPSPDAITVFIPSRAATAIFQIKRGSDFSTGLPGRKSISLVLGLDFAGIGNGQVCSKNIQWGRQEVNSPEESFRYESHLDEHRLARDRQRTGLRWRRRRRRRQWHRF